MKKVEAKKTRITTHPGTILFEEFLMPLNLSIKELAYHIDVSPKKITDIVSRKDRIDSDIAWKLSYSFGTSPEFWMNLQSKYDLSRKRPKAIPKITL